MLLIIMIIIIVLILFLYGNNIFANTRVAVFPHRHINNVEDIYL